MEENRVPELVPASDIEATDEDRELARLIAERRSELGYQEPVTRRLVPDLSDLPAVDVDKLEAEREEAEKLQRRKDDLAKLIASAGQRYAQCRLTTFRVTHPRQQEVRDAVSEYMADLPKRVRDREGVVLYGPVGTGKDHLATAIAGRAICRHGLRVGWVNGQDWFGEVRDSMDEGRSERGTIGRWVWQDLLVLSDPLPPIGPLGQHMATMIYRLIGDRYDNGRPTIVTVNVRDDAEADERLGAATWDRLCDGAWKLCCNWPSYRKPARVVGVRHA